MTIRRSSFSDFGMQASRMVRNFFSTILREEPPCRWCPAPQLQPQSNAPQSIIRDDACGTVAKSVDAPCRCARCTFFLL